MTFALSVTTLFYSSCLMSTSLIHLRVNTLSKTQYFFSEKHVYQSSFKAFQQSIIPSSCSKFSGLTALWEATIPFRLPQIGHSSASWNDLTCSMIKRGVKFSLSTFSIPSTNSYASLMFHPAIVLVQKYRTQVVGGCFGCLYITQIKIVGLVCLC